MEQQINDKILAFSTALTDLRTVLYAAFVQPDKSDYYNAMPKCLKLAQSTQLLLGSCSNIAESQKKIDQLIQELGS